MRALTFPLIAWLGAVQVRSTSLAVDDTARLIGITGVLGTLAVLIYRLGVWRQEMENTKDNVERRLDAIEEMIEQFEPPHESPDE